MRKSGDNRMEMEKVIDRYSSAKDSLKLKAFWFLLENMPGKYSAINKNQKAIDNFYFRVYLFRESGHFLLHANHPQNLVQVHRMRSDTYLGFGKLPETAFIKEPDLVHIKADFLIENIDYAFKVWELPWCRHLDLKEFCEYILPYRLGNEVLESWRKDIFERHRQLLDSLVGTGLSDPMEVARVVHKRIGSGWIYSERVGTYPVTLTANHLWQGKTGNCIQQTQFGGFSMRALGIPTAH